MLLGDRQLPARKRRCGDGGGLTEAMATCRRPGLRASSTCTAVLDLGGSASASCMASSLSSPARCSGSDPAPPKVRTKTEQTRVVPILETQPEPSKCHQVRASIKVDTSSLCWKVFHCLPKKEAWLQNEHTFP